MRLILQKNYYYSIKLLLNQPIRMGGWKDHNIMHRQLSSKDSLSMDAVKGSASAQTTAQKQLEMQEILYKKYW